jgi:hypothetical protein
LSITRLEALKKFGIGLVGTALACFRLAGSAKADPLLQSVSSRF